MTRRLDWENSPGKERCMKKLPKKSKYATLSPTISNVRISLVSSMRQPHSFSLFNMQQSLCNLTETDPIAPLSCAGVGKCVPFPRADARIPNTTFGLCECPFNSDPAYNCFKSVLFHISRCRVHIPCGAKPLNQ